VIATVFPRIQPTVRRLAGAAHSIGVTGQPAGRVIPKVTPPLSKRERERRGNSVAQRNRGMVSNPLRCTCKSMKCKGTYQLVPRKELEFTRKSLI
jgi:hypothetical protein